MLNVVQHSFWKYLFVIFIKLRFLHLSNDDLNRNHRIARIVYVFRDLLKSFSFRLLFFDEEFRNYLGKERAINCSSSLIFHLSLLFPWFCHNNVHTLWAHLNTPPAPTCSYRSQISCSSSVFIFWSIISNYCSKLLLFQLHYNPYHPLQSSLFSWLEYVVSLSYSVVFASLCPLRI